MRRMVILGVIFSLLIQFLPLQAQSGTEDQILEALNQSRAIGNLPALTRENTLNKLAIILLDGFAEDCTFTTNGDGAQVKTVGWTGDYEVVRDCGINKLVPEAIRTFQQQLSDITNTPLLNEKRWTVVGLAVDEQTTSVGTSQYRYVMVLGNPVLTEPAPDAAGSAPAPSVALEASFSDPTLNVTFAYPTGWTPDASSGVTILANAADAPAATDNDPATTATQPFITLDVLDRASLPLSADAGIEEVTKIVVNTLGLTVSTSQEVGVNTYRARTVVATDQNGQAGLVTFWLEDAALMLMVLSTPTIEEAQAWLPTWEQILTTYRPADVVELSQVVMSPYLNAEVSLPADWTVYGGTDQFAMFELSSDRDLFVVGQFGYFTGVVISTLFAPTQSLIDAGRLKAANDLDELLQLNITVAQLSNVTVQEAMVFGQPAYLIQANEAAGFFVYGVMGFVEGNVFFLLATSQFPASIEAFKPTFRTMMSQLRYVEN